MDETLDASAWMEELVARLRDAFGDRLAFAGIQGSRARNEARPDSDIDAVVLIRSCTPDDITAYRRLLAEMPHGELACGFVGSPQVLKAWPRSDSMNLVLDTVPCFGTLDFMDGNFSADDGMQSAKAGAAEIYHGLSHAMAFGEPSLPEAVAACTKAAFFVMRARAFAQTGHYAPSRTAMRTLADKEELSFLDAYDNPSRFDAETLARTLRAYAERILCA